LKKDYAAACRHFIRGNKSIEFAKMLQQWSMKGNPSERDLVITRAVFQCLCLQNLALANAVFDKYLDILMDLPQTPILNFVKMLLLTLERDAYPLMQTLINKYKISVNRDPTFQQYLDQIALVFYKIKPTSGNNFLNDFVKSFLGVEESS